MWLGINSELFGGGDFCLALSNMILLVIMSFTSINILIWEQDMVSAFIYIFVLWKNNLMRTHSAH